MYVRFLRGRQSHYPVWENIYLVRARGPAEAQRRAEAIVQKWEAATTDSGTWGGRPAKWVFAGIRKILWVAHVGPPGVLGPGDELSFSEFSLKTLAQVRRLASGRAVTLSYDE